MIESNGSCSKKVIDSVYTPRDISYRHRWRLIRRTGCHCKIAAPCAVIEEKQLIIPRIFSPFRRNCLADGFHRNGKNNSSSERILFLSLYIHSDAAETNTVTTGSDPLVEVMPAPLLVGSSFYNVIYDTVELEPYFWAVDRIQSEEMLRGTPDGSCLVRPFKMKVG